MPTPQEIVAKHDTQKRIEDETIILKKAHDLTNGEAGNQKLTGEVMEWMVHEIIDHGRLLRALAESQNNMRTIPDCQSLHKGKMLAAKIFGFSFALPMSASVVTIGWLVFMFCRQQGWM